MGMTFDEALNELEPRTIWSSEMRDLLEQLRAEYAPTIEMTQLQYNDLKYYLKNYPLDKFIYDFCELYDTELSEKDLAQAWLHPETIKVVD